MMSAAGPKRSWRTLSGELKLRRDCDLESLQVGSVERRSKPRITNPFPTTVQGTDVLGRPFEAECAIDNMSSRGVYLRLSNQVSLGDELTVVVKFHNLSGATANARLQCHVLRAEPQTKGLFGLALAITGYKFL
jgi:hypothetical protein